MSIVGVSAWERATPTIFFFGGAELKTLNETNIPKITKLAIDIDVGSARPRGHWQRARCRAAHVAHPAVIHYPGFVVHYVWAQRADPV